MILLTEYSNVFTETFTDLFIKTNLSKNQFAKEVGIDHFQITCYLQGTIPITKSVVKICDYFNCSIDYMVGLSDNFSYPNSKKGYNSKNFYAEYQRLLKLNNKTHYSLSKENIVTSTKLSLWKKGGLPKFEVLIAIAYELNGSVDKLLGRIWVKN